MKTAIIVEPEIPENTGFIARLAENFGFELRIVNPEFNLSEAKKTASKAQQKLREAKIFDDLEPAVEDLDFVVGTKPGRGQSLNGFTPREDTSLMIGRESSGLTNRELELCDAIVHIETDEYNSLNQSHAAAIFMYEFFSSSEQEGMTPGQEDVLEDILQTPQLKEFVKKANPSRGEVDRLIGQIKQGK